MTAPDYTGHTGTDQGQTRPQNVSVDHRFAMVPEWIVFHPDLTGDDVRVFAVLLRHDGHEVIPSLTRIGELAGGVSDQTARRCVKRLEAVGAVTVESRFRDGRQTSNRYLLHNGAPSPVRGRPIQREGDGGITADRDGGITADRAEREQEEREQEEREEHLVLVPDDVADEFDVWWQGYPRKVGKPKAAAAFKAAFRATRVRGEDIATTTKRICVGTDAWIAYWRGQRTEMKFVPHPATFLNGHRFNDAPTVGPMSRVIDEDRGGESGRLAL